MLADAQARAETTPAPAGDPSLATVDMVVNGRVIARGETFRTGPIELWPVIGRPRESTYLTVDEVLQVHTALVRHAEGTEDQISPPGPRSMALLESAVGRTRHTHSRA